MVPYGREYTKTQNEIYNKDIVMFWKEIYIPQITTKTTNQTYERYTITTHSYLHIRRLPQQNLFLTLDRTWHKKIEQTLKTDILQYRDTKQNLHNQRTNNIL